MGVFLQNTDSAINGADVYLSLIILPEMVYM